MKLEILGWKPEWELKFAAYRDKGCIPGRVALEHKHMYRVYTEHGDLLTEVSGKMRHTAAGRADYPAVGDWVAVSARLEEGRATIHGVLPRLSKFSRKAAGSTIEEQIVAANIDTVFLVNALNQDFNVRRIERYMILAWESGANPVIVLSKADLCDDVKAAVAEVAAVSVGVTIHVISSIEQQGLEQLTPYLKEGTTVALLGSSGAGKSTLINSLYGSVIHETNDVRHGDDRGKHTTTYREMIILPDGGLLIDTPGMRELQMWDADSGFNASFQDIEALAEQCRFQDCRHLKEPGCAVKQAIAEDELSRDRYDNYVKLQKELAYLARKENRSAQLTQKDKRKPILTRKVAADEE